MNEQKIYKYKDSEYTLAAVTLSVLASAAPLLAEYRKLVNRYTSDIDISKAEKAKAYIDELRTAIEQLKEVESESNDEKEKENISDRIKELEEKLALAQNDYDLDSSIQSSLKLFNECRVLAMLELLGREDIINRFIEAVMIPLNGNNKKIEIDYTAMESIDFVKAAVSDFFVCMAGGSKMSAA